MQDANGSVNNVWTEILRGTSRSSPTIALYLASIHPMLVEALVQGGVIERLYKEEKMSDTLLGTAELDNGPGTYLNVLCRRKFVLRGRGPKRSRPSLWPGYSLSVPELTLVLQDCTTYLRYHDGGTEELADDVDSAVRVDNLK